MSAARSTSPAKGFDWDIVGAENQEPIGDAFAYALRLTHCSDQAAKVAATAYLQLVEKQRAGRLSVSPRAFLMAAVNQQCAPVLRLWRVSAERT